MTLVIGVTYQIIETVMSGAPIVRVHNEESVQIPGPMANPANGDLLAEVIVRLGEDVQERAIEQARQMTRQTP